MSDNEKSHLSLVPDLPDKEPEPTHDDSGKIIGIPTPDSLDPKGRLVEQPQLIERREFNDGPAADQGPQFDPPVADPEQASVRNHPSNPARKQ